jgi:uncharacterized protein
MVLLWTATSAFAFSVPLLPRVEESALLAQSEQAASASHSVQEPASKVVEMNVVPPKPSGMSIYVNDYAHLLSLDEQSILRDRLQRLDKSGSAQASLLILPGTARELAEFAPEIMNQWGIQHLGRKDGVLVLVNADALKKGTRGRIFVATGYRIEGVLPDAKLGRILDETALPDFEQRHYGSGIVKTVSLLADILEKSPELKSKGPTPSDSANWPLIVVLLLLFLGLSRFLKSNTGRRFSDMNDGFPMMGGYGGSFQGGDDFSGGFGGGDDASGGGGTER